METIYISLINEGATVWRPIQAIKLDDYLFHIPNDTNIPEGEEWEFKPGDKIKCKNHTFSNGESGLVAYEKH